MNMGNFSDSEIERVFKRLIIYRIFFTLEVTSFVFWGPPGPGSRQGVGGAGPKGTTNWQLSVHTPIRARAKMHILGAPRGLATKHPPSRTLGG